MEFELTWVDPSLVACRVSGVASAKDYEELLRTLTSSSAFGPETNVLMDFTAVDVSGVSAADIEEVADLRVRLVGRGKARAAVVVGRNSPLRYGLGRMFQSLLTAQTQVEVRVFEAFDEAMAWLHSGDAGRAP